jgi:DNA polymerase-3 subunit gamma/tau
MSSYKVIARQYRPQKFADVVGQEHITRTLQNAIAQDRVGHAYLFVGPRGTGKTTTARIFAKALNCETPQGTEPCGNCQNCREIAAGNSLDVIEIDGASHNKVEDVRDIRDNVQYTPNRSRHKIYIIDEVHMLTPAAWNALLKTLEEPPPHVKFLFATTEPHKVLGTILSRCQRFDLKRIPAHLIAHTIQGIAEKERIFIQPAAIAAIARAADGGMRDAQSIFDQMIAFCGGRDAAAPIREQDVMDVFGLASGQDLKDLTRALVANDLPGIIRHIQAQADCGRDLEHLLGDLIFFLRDVMVAQVIPQAANDAVDGSADDARELADLARAASPDMIPVLLETLMAQESAVRYALNKRIALEVALLRCMREAHSVSIDEVVSRLAEWRRGGVSIQVPPPAPRPPPATPAPPPVTTPAAVSSQAPAPAPATPAKPATPAPVPVEKPVAAPIPAAPPEPPAKPAPVKPAAPTQPASVQAPPTAQPVAAPPATTAPDETGSLSEAELWARLCDRIATVSGQRDIAESLRSTFKAVSRRGNTLTVAWDDTGVEFAAKLDGDKPLLALVEEQFRSLCGNPAAKIARKRWIPELSDGQKKLRQAATAESRLKAEQNPFVKEVCDLFNGTIIDSRGLST